MPLLEDCLALEAKGQRNKAVRKLTHWIESKDKKKPKEARLAWYHLARMVLQLERPADAASYLTKARSLFKKDAELLNLSGIAAKRSRNFDEALGFFDEAFKADKIAIAALANKTLLLVELKRSDEAITSARKLKEVDPQNPAAARFLGNAHLQKGDLLSTIRFLTRLFSSILKT